MTYFLTFHGKLVCLLPHGGTWVLAQCAVDDLDPKVELVSIDVPVEQFRAGFDDYLADRRPALDRTMELPGFGTCAIGRAQDGRCVTLTLRGQRLCSMSNGLVVNDVSVPDWEAFLPVSEAEIAMLRLLLANDWIVRSSGKLVRAGDMTMGIWYNLRVGALALDLREQLPFDTAQWPFRLTILNDGWRIEQICLYRPLIYFTVFKSPIILRQFEVAIQSLSDFGRYDGQVLVITDQPADTIAAMMPSITPERYQICAAAPADGAGYVAARFKIVDLPWSAQFQPVMFMDCDVIFDTSLERMLCSVARSDQITAPLEPFSPMRSSPASGSGLLQMEGLTPGFAVGMNFGTVGIPNVPAHAATLRLIRRIIMDHAAKHGRTALPYLDQEVANYVAFRLTSFGPAINPFVRYGGWTPADTDTAGRIGVVHFWPALRGEDKLAAMQHYRALLDTMQSQNAGSDLTQPRV